MRAGCGLMLGFEAEGAELAMDTSAEVTRLPAAVPSRGSTEKLQRWPRCVTPAGTETWFK